MASGRGSDFAMRAVLIQSAVQLARPSAGPGDTVGVIWGPSGCGKTSLMCKVAGHLAGAEGFAGAGLVAIRLCGTSALSSSARAVLDSISCQLQRSLGLPDQERPADLKGLAALFLELLGHATAERPIAVFIDSLDQLNDEDFGSTEPWR